MSLYSGTMIPEGGERGFSRDQGSKFHSEYAWWGFENGQHQIEAAFHWAEDRGGWDYGSPRNFFLDFSALDENWIRTGATKGSIISTVIGDIRIWAFDIDTDVDTYGNDRRQCLGFGHRWVYRNVSGWKHHKKLLSFYACGNGNRLISEEAFLHILSGFGIKGEFDTLVEDY